MNISINTNIELGVVECCACGIAFGISSLRLRTLKKDHETFYCPNGHKQWFPAETEEEKLKKELKKKEQELAEKVIQSLQLENKLSDANRKLKRVAKGVCPCCNRSFQNLKKHMETKHPEKLKK